MSTPRTQLLSMLAIVLATGAAFWIAEDPESGLLAGGWILLFVLAIHFGRGRSDVIDVIAGVGDERSRELYTRAVAFAGTVIVFVIVGWGLATVIAGEPNETLSLLGAIGGVAFVAGAVYQSRRG